MIGNLSSIGFESFADDGRFPNSALPVIIYRQAIPSAEATPEATPEG